MFAALPAPPPAFVADAVAVRHDTPADGIVRIASDPLALVRPGAVTTLASRPQAGGNGRPLPGGYLHTEGSQVLDTEGRPVRIAAVNWFGMDNTNFGPGGLDAVNWHATMDRMVQEGFNAIRLPFSNQFLHAGVAPRSVDTRINPDLSGLVGLALLDRIVGYAGQIGLKVILDDHRSTAGTGPNDNGLWYDDATSPEQWLADWRMLAAHYNGDATVIAADLMNEPHGPACWGCGNPATDWAAAATQAGDAILAINPSLLIIVEGIQTTKGVSTNWGGNLMGVADWPIRLRVAHRLVYSAHDYGASTSAQPYFADPAYPANLPSVWHAHWGFIAAAGIAPVFVGELGSNLQTIGDVRWMQMLVPYLAGNAGGPAGGAGMGFGYWSWNANTGAEPDGLLQPNWVGVKPAQAAAVHRLTAGGGAASAGAETATADVSVTLASPQSGPVAIAYATRDGTAQAGRDYVAAKGEVTFAPGETARVIPVHLLAAGQGETSRSFDVDLFAGDGASLGRCTATIVYDPTTAVSLATANAWDGFVDQRLTITNTSDRTIHGWQVALTTQDRITGTVWNATVTSQVGETYLLSNTDWNSTLAPGQSAVVSTIGALASLPATGAVRVVHVGP